MELDDVYAKWIDELEEESARDQSASSASSSASASAEPADAYLEQE